MKKNLLLDSDVTFSQAMGKTMERVITSTPHPTRPAHPRLRLAEGVLKAVFTRSPKETTIVVVTDDSEIVLKRADDK